MYYTFISIYILSYPNTLSFLVTIKKEANQWLWKPFMMLQTGGELLDWSLSKARASFETKALAVDVSGDEDEERPQLLLFSNSSS